MKRSTYKSEAIPDTLENHMFYGLTLDEDQKIFRDSIWDKNNIITICNSKSGTGKSTIALGVANLLVQYGLYNEIVYSIFPTQETRMGYLPGDIEDKSAPYMQPLVDACLSLDINPDTAIESNNNLQAIKDGRAYIRFTTDTFYRGINLENKVIIFDEFQNGFFSDCKKVLTRCHDNCKIIIIGHTEQCDIFKHAERSGFQYYLQAFEKIKDDPRVAICELRTNHRGWFSNFCDDVEMIV